MKATKLIAVTMAALVISMSACTEEDACDAVTLTTSLSRARAGDTVRVGACTISGSFVVPSGVTLQGAGRGESTFVVEGEGPALKLLPGASPARVVDVSVVSDGRIALRVTDGETAEVERVDITVTRGVGLGAEALTSLMLEGVTLSGPVDSGNDDDVPYPVSVEESATHGLVAVQVGSLTLTDVIATGFASFGVLLVESSTSWRGGSASENLGTGLMAHGGSTTLEGVELSGTLQGMRGMPAYAGVFAAGATVTTEGLQVVGGEGVGILHDDASVQHVDLTARENRDVAVWAQHCSSFEVSGVGSAISGNGFAGLVVVESRGVVIQDAYIEATSLMTTTVGHWGALEVGDGVHLIEPTGSTTLRNLMLSGNERVGVLIDVTGSSTEDVTIDTVAVSGLGEQLGAIAQGGDVIVGWDDGIDRDPLTMSNDLAFEGTLDAVTAISSDGTTFPAALDAVDGGLAGIIGDCC